MPRDSNSNFKLIQSYLAVTGQPITVPQHNPPLEDIATAITGSLARNGTGPMLANLPMGGFKLTGLATGTDATDAATVGQVTGFAPIGVVQDYALSTLPTGWLWCDGSILLSSTPYTALRAALIADGFKYGQDGSGNPKLPRCNGKTRATRDDMGGTDAGYLSGFYGAVARTLGGILGTASHVLTVGQLAKHRPTFTGDPLAPHDHPVGASYIGSGTSSSGGYILPSGTGAMTAAVSAGTPSGTISQIGNDEAHPNAQPTIIFNTIIRAV